MPSLLSLYTLTHTSSLPSRGRTLTPGPPDSSHGLFSLKVFETAPISLAKLWLQISQTLTRGPALSSVHGWPTSRQFYIVCPNRPPLCSLISSNPWDIKFHQIRLSYALLQWYIWVFILAWGLRPSPLTGFRYCRIYNLQPLKKATHKRKHLIGTCLQFQRVSPLSSWWRTCWLSCQTWC